MKEIQIGIAGYGNIGRGVELAIKQNPDMNLAAVFTRRQPETVQTISDQVPVIPMDQILEWKERIHVLILCGGSATDLPQMGPELAKNFNTVDSFDTHAHIPAYFQAVDQAAKAGGHVCLIATGWDPGLFSLNRLFAEAILPQGETHTFWGAGVSQGHSDAIRRIPGVKNAVQYTIPVAAAMEQAREGRAGSLTARDKHLRQCFVATHADADQGAIETAIKTMPNYFADYETTISFVSEEELAADHSRMPHGGFVIRQGRTGQAGSSQTIEYGLKLESNPEFTSSVLVSYARAVHRLSQQGVSGAQTVFDIPPGLLSPKTPAELRAQLL